MLPLFSFRWILLQVPQARFPPVWQSLCSSPLPRPFPPASLVDIAAEDDARGEERRHRQRHQKEHRLDRAARRQHHGGKAEDTADDVQRRDGLLLVEAHVDEAVVDVAAVRRHRVLPVGKAADDGKERVEHRQAQDQERHRERHDGVILEKALDRDRRKDVAKERRARVAP